MPPPIRKSYGIQQKIKKLAFNIHSHTISKTCPLRVWGFIVNGTLQETGKAKSTILLAYNLNNLNMLYTICNILPSRWAHRTKSSLCWPAYQPGHLGLDLCRQFVLLPGGKFLCGNGFSHANNDLAGFGQQLALGQNLIGSGDTHKIWGLEIPLFCRYSRVNIFPNPITASPQGQSH